MKRGKQIIIAEDNLADLQLIQSAFEEINLSVNIIIVKDGQELLDYFASESISNLGLLLLDLNLPKVSGMDILKKFYADEVLKKIPVIVFTACQNNADIITCYETGANACIKKPEDINEFSTVIRAITNFWLGINVLPSFRVEAV